MLIRWHGSLLLLIGLFLATTCSLRAETDELLMTPMSVERLGAINVGENENVVRTAVAKPSDQVSKIALAAENRPLIVNRIPEAATGEPQTIGTTQPRALTNAGGVNPNAASAPATRPRPVAISDGTEDSHADHDHPPVNSASFLNVTTGVTTQEELFAAWGKPKKESKTALGAAYLYALDGFNHVEVQMNQGKVYSVSITFDEPLPSGQVREGLAKELQKAKPIMIADEKGEVLGHVFPEKGVKLIFAPSDPKTGATSTMVTRFVIEPISAEPFVLRAEGYLNDLPEESKRDLNNAIKIDPKNSKAYWLLAQIELAQGNSQDAARYCTNALELDDTQLQYHVTMARILAQRNHTDKARAYLEQLIGECNDNPSVKASAQCLLGDIWQNGAKPDYMQASKFHMAAIETAKPLLGSSNPSARLGAKEIFLNAHLGTAKDIAWGNGWTNKQASAMKWVAAAKDILKDPELTARKPGTKDFPLRIAIVELAIQSEMPATTDIEPYIQNVLAESSELINLTSDAIQKMKHQWETGLALYNAAQIYQVRQQYEAASKYCEMSVQFMEEAMPQRISNAQDVYLIARIYFRLGAIQAIGKKDHAAAVAWYEKTRPLLNSISSKIGSEECGRFGDTCITMGVTYWNVNKQEDALALTLQGTQLIEKAVNDKFLEPSALVIPYKNVSTMYRRLNQTDNANLYQEKSDRLKTAAQPGSVR